MFLRGNVKTDKPPPLPGGRVHSQKKKKIPGVNPRRLRKHLETCGVSMNGIGMEACVIYAAPTDYTNMLKQQIGVGSLDLPDEKQVHP